ncbi:MAG: hypothetical protein UT34_C0002G0111 [candidate division WS6 bacterium GW2011_GWF2_39_15]|uniref:Uncharacterized protein n=1 Tax=candidate division WS6 bacterium GW2011_GWF2_39_15 TaxID=1619100 RepID=A0A0G0MNH8_9BACT|nr:MAG: hypothetical protein UT34_C0002G0111 [candidate division WS6 bacterium GW2011_GWF2_39_15]
MTTIIELGPKDFQNPIIFEATLELICQEDADQAQYDLACMFKDYGHFCSETDDEAQLKNGLKIFKEWWIRNQKVGVQTDAVTNTLDQLISGDIHITDTNAVDLIGMYLVYQVTGAIRILDASPGESAQATTFASCVAGYARSRLQ